MLAIITLNIGEGQSSKKKNHKETSLRFVTQYYQQEIINNLN
jgi:hypothetical protein